MTQRQEEVVEWGYGGGGGAEGGGRGKSGSLFTGNLDYLTQL